METFDFRIVTLAFQWGIVAVILTAILISALAVKFEHRYYRQNSQPFTIGKLTLPIPHWWQLSHQISTNAGEKNFFRFVDSHANAKWAAEFQVLSMGDLMDDIEDIEDINEDEVLKEVLLQLIKHLNIVLDTETILIKETPQFPELNQTKFSMVKIEGPGTKNDEERIYGDFYLVKPIADLHVKETNSTLIYCSSISPVLNGIIAGPYFQEVVERSTALHPQMAEPIYG